MIHVYFGDGKGKTSAAIGAAIRAAGAGLCVSVYQFLKDGMSSEVSILKNTTGITYFQPPKIDKFVFQMNLEEKKNYKKEEENYFKEAFDDNESFDLIVLDEVLDLVDLQFIEKTELLDRLEKIMATHEMILTGHDLFPELEEIADYITNIKKIKHPFDKGIKSRVGIEY